MFYQIFLFVYFLMSCLAFLFYRKNFQFLTRKYGLLSWIFASIVFFVTRPSVLYLPDQLSKILAFFGGYWIFFLYYSILLLLIHTLILNLIKFRTKDNDRLKHYSVVITKAGLCVILICLLVGTYVAYNPIARYETITTKKVSAPVRLVLVADLHLGTILGKSYCDKMVTSLNDEKPDLVVIAGDIIDNNYALVQRQGSMTPLEGLKSRLGVIAVLGNHDYFDQRTADEVNDLKAMGISVLVNAKKSFKDISVVGLKDYSKEQTTDNLKHFAADSDNKYKILVDHQPRRILPASEAGYDLYLAGHTHGGAFFPNEIFTKIIHELDYGRKNFAGMTAIVTSGYGFFGIPVRLGVSPEYVVIDIKPSAF